MINGNIRCFEIGKLIQQNWENNKINGNIRCFEIEKEILQSNLYEKINGNIRCFEMYYWFTSFFP